LGCVWSTVTGRRQGADRDAGFTWMAGCYRVVQSLQLFGATFTSRNEHNDRDQDRATYGCARRYGYSVHVTRHRNRCPYFSALAVWNRVWRDGYFFQRYNAHDNTFLR